MSTSIGSFTLEPEKISDSESRLIFDQNLILSKTTLQNLEKILFPLLEGRNLLLVGDAGIGKNALIYYINKIRNLPTIRFSFNQDTLPEDLSGSFRILPDGFHWNDGPLTQAMRKGYTFVADEMNLASPEILKRFISVLERKTLTLLEKDGSELNGHARFNFVATQNPTRGFEGRKVLPESISKYFTIIQLDTYPIEEEVQIMQGLFTKAPAELVHKICLLQRNLERAIWDNELAKTDLEHYHFNIRTGERFWSRTLKPGGVPNLDDKIFLDNVFNFYVNVFRIQEDRETALKIAAGALQADLAKFVTAYTEQMTRPADEIFIGRLSSAVSNIEPPSTLDPLPLTGQRLRLLEDILSSLENNENLLLEGADAARMGPLLERLAWQMNIKSEFIFLARGMHTSDILGALRPTEIDGKKEVRWLDGPLTRALREQSWIILENIEAAGSELVEKLNMLLDHASMLSLPPEAEGEAVVKKEGKARIIALKRTRQSRNQTTISRALRNRFYSMQIPVVHSDAELKESAALYWQLLFGDSDKLDKPSVDLLERLALFHARLSEAAETRKIASSQAEPLRFREENLLRWLTHVDQWLSDTRNLQSVLNSGAETHYISSIPDEKDWQWARELLRRILQDLPLDDLNSRLTDIKKKSSHQIKLDKPDWDQKKHFRDPITGKARIEISGNPLKKGLRIDTPETGGKIKEGPDAWYGKETQGNKGFGEPAGGGGAWGLKNEQLFQEFLKKYKPKWQYHMGLNIKDFYDIFGKMLQELDMDLENALDSNLEIERRLMSQGNRVDVRKYLAYRANHGSDRIFDRTRIYLADDKLKGLEFVFLINKGRRLFNFEYSVASVIALQSAIEVLWDRKIALKVFGYSDFENMKTSINLVEYTGEIDAEPTPAQRVHVFDKMANEWNGDTVDEYSTLRHIPDLFSSEAVTRIAVIVSDFRGHRARANITDEVNSRDSVLLADMVKTLSRQNYAFLGVQTGSRYIAEHLFEHHLWINGDNFSRAPAALAEIMQKLILQYHRVSV